jgi:hypothetical protein
MNENELDQMLDRWKSPLPSRGLRARVLNRYPRRERLWFGRPLRWAGAMALVLLMFALGTGLAQHGVLDNFAGGVREFSDGVGQWFDDMWTGHIVMAFRNSQPKVYVDGELQTDAVVGGSRGGLWIQFPGEGRYLLAYRLGGFRGSSTPARFDGHTIDFQAGGRSVRVESRHHYGFGAVRTLYMLGPAAR